MANEHIDMLVRTFGRILSASWTEAVAASRCSQTGSFMGDWLQANWEMIVEGGVDPLVFLQVYGSGADCNGSSSRVYKPDASATYAVVCRAAAGRPIVRNLIGGQDVMLAASGLPFEELVSLEGTWYARKPPFDCVLVEEGDEPIVLRMDEIVFALGLAQHE